MKKLKALICKWFGHRWVDTVQGNYTARSCARCNLWGSSTMKITLEKPVYLKENDNLIFKDNRGMRDYPEFTFIGIGEGDKKNE